MVCVPSFLVNIILQLSDLGSARLSSLLPAGSLLLDAAHLLFQILHLPIPLQPPLALLIQRLLQALVGGGTLQHGQEDVRLKCTATRQLASWCCQLLLEVPHMSIPLPSTLALLIRRLLQALIGWQNLQHGQAGTGVKSQQAACLSMLPTCFLRASICLSFCSYRHQPLHRDCCKLRYLRRSRLRSCIGVSCLLFGFHLLMPFLQSCIAVSQLL